MFVDTARGIVVAFTVMGVGAGTAARAEAPSGGTQPSDAPIYVHLDPGEGKDVELVRVLGTSVSTARTTSGQAAVISTVHVERMCKAPCNRLVPGGLNNQYFVVGKGMPASDAFDFGAHQQAVKLNVVPGSSAKRTGGYLLGVGGLTGVIGGGALLATGLLTGSLDGASGPRHPAAPDRGSTSIGGGMTTLGAVGLAAGVALLVPAIWMAATSGTKTSTEAAPNLAPKQEAPAPATSGFEVRYFDASAGSEVEG